MRDTIHLVSADAEALSDGVEVATVGDHVRGRRDKGADAKRAEKVGHEANVVGGMSGDEGVDELPAPLPAATLSELWWT